MPTRSIRTPVATCLALLALLAAAWPTDAQEKRKETKPQVKRWGDVDLELERDLVTIGVTVVDSNGRRVTGLDPSHFEVYDNKVKQEIAFFGDQDEPATIGVIFDTSGSMTGWLGASHHSLRRFGETSIREDEYFLVTFDERARLTADFTHDVASLAGKLTFVEAKGSTALLDAIYVGINKAREGHNRKRALLVITDGGENSSRYTGSEVKDLVSESDVPIYTIGINAIYGGYILNQLASMSGGRAFYPRSDDALIDTCIQVAIDLRKQYGIGYYPTTDIHDGKWHELRVKVKTPPGLPPLKPIAKSGYYGTGPRK